MQASRPYHRTGANMGRNGLSWFRRSFLLLLLIGLGSAITLATDAYVVVPQLAIGDGWSSDVFVTNQDAARADNLTLSFYATGTGVPLAVSTNLGNGASFQFSLEGGASQTVRVTTAGSLQVGYAVLRFPESRSVRTTLVVRWKTGGATVTQLGVPGQEPSDCFSFPVEYDPSKQVSMGVAVVLAVLDTPLTGSHSLVVSLIDQAGAVVRTAVVNLPAGGHLARMLNESELFPGLNQFTGNVVVSSAVRINALALRLEGTVLGSVGVNSGPIVRPFMVNTSAIAEVETNNTIPQAMPLTAPARVSAGMGTSGDVDCFRFTGTSGDIVTVLTDSRSLVSGANTVLTLLDPSGAVLARNDQNRLLLCNDSFIQAVLPQAGTYAVRVEESENRGGPSFGYELHLRTTGSTAAVGPSITQLSPTSGHQGDAFGLSIFGANLGDVTGISFTPATGIQLTGMMTGNPTSVSVAVRIAADAATGTRQVSVTSPAGTSGSLPFTIQSTTSPVPSITSLSPNSAVAGTSFDLVISGTNLGDVTSVDFSPESGVVVLDAAPERTATQVKVPVMLIDAAPGVRQVAVTSPGGTSNLLPFTILSAPPPPSLISITPDTFTLGSTVDVTIAGNSLDGIGPLQFSSDQGMTITNQQITSNQITARFQIAPKAFPGTRTIWVARGGVSNSLSFTIIPASRPGHTPTISNLSVGTPVFSQGRANISISFDFVDLDGDIRDVDDPDAGAWLLFTGPCHEGLTGSFLNRSGQTSGTISFTLGIYGYSTGNFTVNMQLIDAAGNGSNILTFQTTAWMCQLLPAVEKKREEVALDSSFPLSEGTPGDRNAPLLPGRPRLKRGC